MVIKWSSNLEKFNSIYDDPMAIKSRNANINSDDLITTTNTINNFKF